MRFFSFLILLLVNEFRSKDRGAIKPQQKEIDVVSLSADNNKNTKSSAFIVLFPAFSDQGNTFVVNLVDFRKLKQENGL